MKYAQKSKLPLTFDFKNEWWVPSKAKLEQIKEVHLIIYKKLL
jgi:hypothetical protein